MKRWVAERLRRLADRIDYEGAPKCMSWSFTIEQREGIRFRQDGRGCPLWYLGNADYERAHDEADSAPSPLILPPEGGTFPVDGLGIIRPDGEAIGGWVTFTPVPDQDRS